MKYNNFTFTHFTINTEIEMDVLYFMGGKSTSTYISDLIKDDIKDIIKKHKTKIEWYIEIEDTTSVFVEVRKCNCVKIIKDLFTLIRNKFGKANLLLYIEDNPEDEFACISDSDEDFNWKLLED